MVYRWSASSKIEEGAAETNYMLRIGPCSCVSVLPINIIGVTYSKSPIGTDATASNYYIGNEFEDQIDKSDNLRI